MAVRRREQSADLCLSCFFANTSLYGVVNKTQKLQERYKKYKKNKSSRKRKERIFELKKINHRKRKQRQKRGCRDAAPEFMMNSINTRASSPMFGRLRERIKYRIKSICWIIGVTVPPCYLEVHLVCQAMHLGSWLQACRLQYTLRCLRMNGAQLSPFDFHFFKS